MNEILMENITLILEKQYPEVLIPSFDIGIPSDRTRADFVCTIAFSLSKILKKDAFLIASEIVELLNNDELSTTEFSFSASKPGFINIFVNNTHLLYMARLVLNQADSYGHNQSLKGEKWVVEHTSPNPNKAMHLGHLRNNLTGMAISKILEANGATVFCDAVDNDRGISIIKAMYGYLIHKHKLSKNDSDVHYWFEHQDEWISPKDVPIKSDHFVGECYLLGNEDFKSSEEIENIMRDMLLKWESKDPKVWALWAKILGYAHDGIEQTLAKLGNRWDKVWHEHEHYSMGKEYIQEGLEKGLFIKTENGAVLTQLEKFNIPDTIALRSDGASLYLTQDIGLTKLKKDYYHANKLVWVIGPEQSLAMRQLFAVCEQLGIGEISDFYHISYGLVNMTDSEGNVKKMSSRDGGTLLIDDLIENIKKQLILLRPGYTEEEAEKISIATIKFTLLKYGRKSDACFDVEASLKIDGVGGVYILYAYARMCSLLTKGNILTSDDVNFSPAEKELLVNINYFPIVVKNTIKDFSTQDIAEYLIQLCQSFNTLYNNEKFINEGDEQETGKKLFIAKVCSITIKNALSLLGITPVQKI